MRDQCCHLELMAPHFSETVIWPLPLFSLSNNTWGMLMWYLSSINKNFYRYWWTIRIFSLICSFKLQVVKTIFWITLFLRMFKKKTRHSSKCFGGFTLPKGDQIFHMGHFDLQGKKITAPSYFAKPNLGLISDIFHQRWSLVLKVEELGSQY